MGSNLDVNILNNLSFQDNNMWEFYFLDLPPSLGNTKSRIAEEGLASVLFNTVSLGVEITYFKYLVQSVGFGPIRGLDQNYDNASRKNYFSAVQPFSDVSLTFLETDNYSVLSFLKALQNKSYSDRTNTFISADPNIMGLLISYRKNRRTNLGNGTIQDLQEIIADNASFLQINQIFTLQNMKLKETGTLDLNYSGSAPVTIDTTFSVENIESASLGSLNPIFQAASIGIDSVTDTIGTIASLFT